MIGGFLYATPVDDSIKLRMTGLQRLTPLVLSWREVPGAARYDVQVWLVQAAPGQTITLDSGTAARITAPDRSL